MRILVLCKRYYTNKDLIADRFGRLYHLSVETARLGGKVQVLAFDYHNYCSKTVKMEGVVFRSIPVKTIKTLFLPIILHRYIKIFNPDIIVASGDSHIGYISMVLARVLEIPFIFDVYDYYPAFPGNRIPGMKSMFFRAVKGADSVICASDSLLNKLLKLNCKSFLIENGVDTKIFCHLDMIKSRRAIGFSADEILIGYFGSIDQDRGPLLIEACRILIANYPSLRLLLAGNLKNVDLRYPWITYYGELPQKDLPLLINACNVVTLPYSLNEQIEVSGACKIAEYLACGRPVVATNVSCHKQIFENSPQSLCETTAFSMAESIKLQIKKPQISKFPDRLSWSALAKKSYEKINEIVS